MLRATSSQKIKRGKDFFPLKKNTNTRFILVKRGGGGQRKYKDSNF